MTTPYEDGSPNCRICVLCEAPARNEIRMGKPLVGRSGMLFNSMIHEASLVRSDLYILNVWPFEVKKDEKSGKIYSPDGDLLWGPKQLFTVRGLQEAEGTLERLLNSRANVICPMGNVALSLLFGDSRISKWRGSILEAWAKYLEGPWEKLKGRKLVPTFHPAYIIRGNFTAQYTVIHDLQRLREEAEDSQILLPPRELIIDPSFNEVMAFMQDMEQVELFSHDIECLNNQISCMSYSSDPAVAMSVPLIDSNGRHRWTEEQETELWLQHARLMGDPNIRKVGHNFLFDTSFEREQNNIWTDLSTIECTMCAQHIMHCDFPKGLDYTCSIRTREPYYKDDGKLWSKPWVDMDRFWRYNALDAAVALECWLDMQPELEDGYMTSYRELTLDMFPIMTFMMMKGLRVNIDRLNKIKREIGGDDGKGGKIGQLISKLNEVAEYPFNPGSPKQCIQYFYVTKGIKPYISRKTGQPTTDDKAMASIYKRYGLEEARIVQDIRTYSKQYGSFLDMSFDPDGFLRFSINPRGTVTSRWSTSETIRKTGHNVQNIPDEFRDFIEADDG